MFFLNLTFFPSCYALLLLVIYLNYHHYYLLPAYLFTMLPLEHLSPSTLSKTFPLPSHLLSSPPLHPFLFFSLFFFHISISSNPTLTYITYFSPNESRSSGFGACAVYHSGLFLFSSFRLLRFNTLLCE